MTQLLEQVIEKIRSLSPERQDEIAAVVEQMAAETQPYTKAQQEKIETGLAQADRGEFVPDERVAALFRNYRDT